MKAGLFSFLLLAGCAGDEIKYDASGAFEADETIVSSEANGILLQFDIEEGLNLEKGDTIGYVDSLQLHLKKKQLQVQMKAVLSRKPDIDPQLASLKAQLRSAEKDQQRYETLVKGDAAPVKKLDDIRTQVEVLKAQIAATESSLGISSKSISEESLPLSVQVEQINDQIRRCILINPVKGTVLVKYAMQSELTASGKPLYKIADLSSLILRAYITADQLPEVRIGNTVKVLTDADDGMKEHEGIVEWISDKAEFTPKSIQTKKEREDKVYAVKIAVKNDGSLKPGMYAEVMIR